MGWRYWVCGPMQSPSGNGDWVVYMSILKEELGLIEREAGHVFRPLTLGCLDEFEEETLAGGTYLELSLVIAGQLAIIPVSLVSHNF
ncbi:hypothetical protein CFP56_041566 [Quercus suber]|uniref:Uncharacterized protein n=1 Tax=Quercus suber TaxID=58331 RepID=A0AAW0IV88_QUESU